MFGMIREGKRIFRIGDRQYELLEVDGPIEREGKLFPAQFDHAAGVLRVSKSVPMDDRPWVVAVAVSDACFRLWRPIPVLFPKGWPS